MPNINEILAWPCYNASSSRGAAMGRQNQWQGNPEEPLYIQRLEMVDGDYDTGGAYWGCGSPETGWIYCAFTDPETTQEDEPVMIFVRAKNVEEAKQLVDDILVDDGWQFVAL